VHDSAGLLACLLGTSTGVIAARVHDRSPSVVESRR
jgi:hypothetical protein